MDFITDKSGRHLLRIAGIIALPDYVKQASVDDASVDQLPISCFADQGAREFPINTPAHTLLSYAYCKSAGVTTPRLIERIKRAGEKLNIMADLAKVDVAFGQSKQAGMKQAKNYAIVIDFEGGGDKQACEIKGVQHFYAIDSAQEIQDSAIALDNDKSQLPLDLYVQGAREIVKAAHVCGLENRFLPERIRFYGTEHYTDFSNVEYAAAQRLALTGDTVYTDIAKSASLNEENHPVDDYIKLWELADAHNGIVPTKSIPDPYRIFNIGQPKQAYDQNLTQHVLIGGAVVPIAALAQVDEGEVKQRFPKAAAEAITALVKSAALAATDDAAALAGTLSGSVQKALLRLIVAQESALYDAV